MGKRRAHEISKELGIELKQLADYAKKLGITLKNHMSSLEEDDVIRIDRLINKSKEVEVTEKRVGKSVIRRRRAKPKKAPVKEKVEEVSEEAPEITAEVEEKSEATSEDQAKTKKKTKTNKKAGKKKNADKANKDKASEDKTSEEVLPEDTEATKQDVKVTEKTETVTEATTKEEPEAKQEAKVVEGEQVAETADETPAETTDKKVAEEADKTPKKKTRKRVKINKDDDPRKPALKKVKKQRQISTIVNKIDVEDLQPASPPPRQQQRGGGGGRPYDNNRSRPSARRSIDPMEISQPVVDSAAGKRKGKGGKSYDSSPSWRSKGKGTRKRHTIDDSYFSHRGGKGKRKGKRLQPQKTTITTPKAIKRVIKLETDTIIVGELAKRMGIKANQLILKLMQMGLQTTINKAIDLDTATLLANEFEFEIENAVFEEDTFLGVNTEEQQDNMEARTPIVTVMGHVDHGKTSILDYIRDTNVTDGEAGGITQHIGAYVVRKESGNITFLDTPGHEAFTSMRARGAQVTDLVILVVAADDGVMPQTIEAINHSRAAGVPMIVAVNKIDKSNADPNRVRNELMQQSVVPEDLGGDVIMVNVSAKTGDGIDTLLEMVTLQSELLELKANYKREQAEAIVIEGKLDRGRGPVGTVLVRHGILKVGNYFVSGAQSSKIKALIDDSGKRISEAGPSMPVEILGFNEVPIAGEAFNTLSDEKQAKAIAQNRYLKKRETELAKTSRVSLEELVERVKAGESQTLSMVVKGDVQGTVEALKDSLVKEATEEVKIDIISTGVGGITESDVLFAAASNALIIGFNVRPEKKAQILAEKEGVQIRIYSVIYEVLEDIQDSVQGLAAPKIREEIVGHIEVRETFQIPKVGTIAGCYVTDGKAIRGVEIRLLRENIVIYTGKLHTLRRFKDDVSEVAKGFECGVGIENYNDIKVGDGMEFFREVEIKPEIKKRVRR